MEREKYHPPPIHLMHQHPEQPVPVICTSRKWVLPPRPKPGRKPSADAPAAVKRKAQNRAAQKAYRERRAADTSVSPAANPAAAPDKKRKPAATTKTRQKDAEAAVKQEPGAGEFDFADLAGLTLSLNEPSMDIKIKTEEQRDPSFFSMSARGTDHSGNSSNDDASSAKPLSKDKQTILDLRAALHASTRETARLKDLVAELRGEIQVLKDLKVAEKAFLYDDEPSQGPASQGPDSADSAASEYALKSNPFFGDRRALLSDETSLTSPMSVVQLPKREYTTPTSLRRFKRDPSMLETDFTLAFTKPAESSSLSPLPPAPPQSNPASVSSSWTAASEISPGGSDDRHSSTPNTSSSDDELRRPRAAAPKRVISTSAAACAKGASCCKKRKKSPSSADGPSDGIMEHPPQPDDDDDDDAAPPFTAPAAKRVLVVDPCGFCSNGTPCLCLEAAGGMDPEY